jgi:hypothetical protein
MKKTTKNTCFPKHRSTKENVKNPFKIRKKYGGHVPTSFIYADYNRSQNQTIRKGKIDD